MGFRGRIARAIIGLSCLIGFHDAVTAETICESSAVEDYLPSPPQGCQKKRIEAAGNLSFGILRSAETLGLKAWQHQVLMRFGERFQDWKNAACKKVECSAATMEGSRRCLYSAFPCSPDADQAQLATLNEQNNPPSPPIREAHQEIVAPPLPTVPEVPPEDREEAPLSAPEIKEMQQLLISAGYHVSVDGVFGDETKRAITKWRRDKGFPARPVSARESLDRLRTFARK